MPLPQTMTPPTTLTSSIQPSASPIANLSSVGGSIQNLSQSGMSYKESGENNNGVAASSSPGVQHNVYSSNMPPTPTSMVTILGPTSGKPENVFPYKSLVLNEVCLGNSNSNEAPCTTDSSNNNNNIQQLSNQWGVPSSPQLNRNSSPTNPTTLSQLGVHSQGLTTFGQNGLHNSSLHGYTTAHNASKGFSHQPFYSWY